MIFAIPRFLSRNTYSGILALTVSGLAPLFAQAASTTANANAIIMTNPEEFGTAESPMLLPYVPSQQPIEINMVSPGTTGIPGPATAHHGIDSHCTKQNFFAANPGIGEMDCMNIVVRQDGINSDTKTNGGDAGDVAAVLSDVESTLRSQNFSAYMESHTSVVDTKTNTVPYLLDLQEGVISTIGQPGDDGSVFGKSSMQAFFAALIDGHGSGLKIVEQPDTTGHGGKLGHGVIDNIIEAGRYTGQQTYRVDGNGATTATMWQLGSDSVNTNLELGMPSNPSGTFATSTPYIDFNGVGTMSNVRLISDAVGQITIVNQGAANYVFSKHIAYFAVPVQFSSSITAANVTVNGGIVFPLSRGNQTILTTDVNGALHVGGTGSNAKLSVDEPMQSSAVVSTGDVSGATLSSANSVTYGKSLANGAHQVTEMSLSASLTNGSVALTPQGGAESTINNIAVVGSGAVKMSAVVVCQNGTDIASWLVSGNYMVKGGSLKLMGASTLKDMLSTSGAGAWQASPAVNAVISSPQIIVSIPLSVSNAQVSCTADTKVMVVR